MARKIGEIYGEIKLKNQQFNAGLAQSQSKMKAFGSAAKIAFAAMAAAAVAATVAVIKMTKDTVRYANEVRKAALATGVAVEQFQELAYAAKQEHADITALEKGLGNLTIRLGYAGDGLETYLRYFRALGIEYKNQDGTLRNTIDVFYDIADKANKATLSTEELAAITQLFGARAGRVLIPMLKKGSEWFKTMAQEGRTLGIIMKEEDVEAVKAFDDKMTALKETINALKRTFVIGLLPTLDDLAQKFKDGMIDGASYQKTIEDLGTAFGSFISGVSTAISKLVEFKNTINDLIIAHKILIEEQEGLMEPTMIDFIKSQIKHYKELIENENKNIIIMGEGKEIIKEYEEILGWWEMRLKQLEGAQINVNYALTTQNKIIKKTISPIKKVAEETERNINRMGEFGGSTHQTFVDLSEYAGMGRTSIEGVDNAIFNAKESAIAIGDQFLETMLMGTMSFASIADAVGGVIKQLLIAIAKAVILKFIMSAIGLSRGGYVPGGGGGDIATAGAQKGAYIPAAMTGGKSYPTISSGWVTQPHVLVGEGRGGELVIPEDKMKDMVHIDFHNASPHSWAEVIINLPQGDKQRIYRRAIKPAADREGNR